MMRRFILLAALFLIPCAPAAAQSTSAVVVAACGTPPAAYPVGSNRQVTQDTTGKLCGDGGGVGPSARTIVPLDIATVTTGGTAVTALNAGHRNAGGFLFNPIGATIALCVNEQGTASGTTSAGATTCVQPGQSYSLTPAAGAVSVITSDSAHPFSGEGLN